MRTLGRLVPRGSRVIRVRSERAFLRELPRATHAIVWHFRREWFATGDLASIDDDGLITIRGRKKALIVNREGKNIYPEEVENVIGKDPAIQDVVVVGYTMGGDPGEKVGAIVYPNEDWFKEQNGGALPDWAEVEKAAIKHAQERSAELADYKRVRKVVVWKEPLERTSIGKVRRVAYKGKLDE